MRHRSAICPGVRVLSSISEVIVSVGNAAALSNMARAVGTNLEGSLVASLTVGAMYNGFPFCPTFVAAPLLDPRDPECDC